MLKDIILRPVIMAVVMAVFACVAMASQVAGPFDVRIHLSHLPNIGEEVAVICSVTSGRDTDSTAMLFWCPDTANAKMIEGQAIQYNCKFKKGETKEFIYTMVFQDEGFFLLIASFYHFFPGGIDCNHGLLRLQTHRDGKAQIVDHIPVRSQDHGLRGARLDSLKSKGKRRKQPEGTDD